MAKGKILFRPIHHNYTVLEKELMNINLYFDSKSFKERLTYDTLKRYDAVVIDEGHQSEFSSKGLIKYVMDGHGLLLNYDPFRRSHSISKDKGGLRKVGEVFGLLDLNQDFKLSEFWLLNPYPKTWPWGKNDEIEYLVEQHPITRNINKIYSSEDLCPLKIDENLAKVLVSVKGEFSYKRIDWKDLREDYIRKGKGVFPVFAVNKKWRVGVFSSKDIAPFNDESILRYDNLPFIKNLLQWLCGIEMPRITFPFMYQF